MRLDCSQFIRPTNRLEGEGKHTGEHATCIAELLQDPSFREFLGALKQDLLYIASNEDRINILLMCPWGYLRSIAAARIVQHVLATSEQFVPMDVISLTKPKADLYNPCAESCEHCSNTSPEKIESLKEATNIFNNLQFP